MSDRFDEWLQREPELVVEQLGTSLRRVTDGRTNALVSGELVVDTLGTPGAARALAAVLGRAPSTLVYSNDHLDRSGWGRELGSAGEVVAHHATARAVRGRGAPSQLAVTREVRESETIAGVELFYPGPLQGTGNLAAWFPGERVLFAVGPLPGARYGLLPDYHLEQYCASARRLLEVPFETFVPGRGRTMTRAELERAIDYVAELQVVSQKAFGDGVSVWDIRAMGKYAREKLRGSFGDLDGWNDHVATSAFRVVHHYLMGGWGLEDTQEPDRAYA
jgi:hypothetical protein